MKQSVIIQQTGKENILKKNLMFPTAAGGLLWVLHLLLKKKEEKRTQENTQNSIKHRTR